MSFAWVRFIFKGFFRAIHLQFDFRLVGMEESWKDLVSADSPSDQGSRGGISSRVSQSTGTLRVPTFLGPSFKSLLLPRQNLHFPISRAHREGHRISLSSSTISPGESVTCSCCSHISKVSSGIRSSNRYTLEKHELLSESQILLWREQPGGRETRTPMNRSSGE